MANTTKYLFSDLTQPEVDDIIERARAERSQAIRDFFYSLFHRHAQPQGSRAEFATQVPTRVTPC